MKRGLVVLDDSEISAAERERRVHELRERISADGVDVALVYGDVHRSDDIGYLTNLCIYWNEGVLAVPAAGEPVFLTKLSPRVHGWMRRTSTVSEVRSGRGFGALVREYLGDGGSGVIGLVDARRWPATVVGELEEVVAALPGWELRLLGDLVRDQRLIPSPGELTLLRAAGRLVGRAAGRAGEPGRAASARAALVERELRGSGFADVLVTGAATGDGIASIEITGQYRHGWLRAARLVDGAGAPWTAALHAGLATAVDAATAGASPAEISAAAEPLLAGLPLGTACDVAWINQADLSTNGEYERHEVHTRLRAGTVGVVSVEALFADGGRAVVADTVLVEADATRRLTAVADAEK